MNINDEWNISDIDFDDCDDDDNDNDNKERNQSQPQQRLHLRESKEWPPLVYRLECFDLWTEKQSHNPRKLQ